MVANDWLLQTLADTLDVAVERPVVTETTALGAACLAGLRNGFFDGLEGFARTWRSAGRFEPQLDAETRAARYAGWQDAVRRVRSAA
jgi:glycerol kinase